MSVRSSPISPGVGTARRLVGAGFEIGIAEPAVAAAADAHALADLGQVGERLLFALVEELRADRHLEHGVGTLGTRPVLAHAVGAGLALEVLLVAEVDQRVQTGDAFDHDVAALAAVAAVRPAELDEFLAPEGDAPRPAVAGADIDAGLIEELHEIACENREAGRDCGFERSLFYRFMPEA